MRVYVWRGEDGVLDLSLKWPGERSFKTVFFLQVQIHQNNFWLAPLIFREWPGRAFMEDKNIPDLNGKIRHKWKGRGSLTYLLQSFVGLSVMSQACWVWSEGEPLGCCKRILVMPPLVLSGESHPAEATKSAYGFAFCLGQTLVAFLRALSVAFL